MNMLKKLFFIVLVLIANVTAFGSQEIQVKKDVERDVLYKDELVNIDKFIDQLRQDDNADAKKLIQYLEKARAYMDDSLDNCLLFGIEYEEICDINRIIDQEGTSFEEKKKSLISCEYFARCKKIGACVLGVVAFGLWVNIARKVANGTYVSPKSYNPQASKPDFMLRLADQMIQDSGF